MQLQPHCQERREVSVTFFWWAIMEVCAVIQEHMHIQYKSLTLHVLNQLFVSIYKASKVQFWSPYDMTFLETSW